jgi:hypothetical protein
MQKTAQRFTDEGAMQVACFRNLEDDVVLAERRAARVLFVFFSSLLFSSFLSPLFSIYFTLSILADDAFGLSVSNFNLQEPI